MKKKANMAGGYDNEGAWSVLEKRDDQSPSNSTRKDRRGGSFPSPDKTGVRSLQSSCMGNPRKGKKMEESEFQTHLTGWGGESLQFGLGGGGDGIIKGFPDESLHQRGREKTVRSGVGVTVTGGGEESPTPVAGKDGPTHLLFRGLMGKGELHYPDVQFTKEPERKGGGKGQFPITIGGKNHGGDQTKKNFWSRGNRGTQKEGTLSSSADQREPT